jgi:hypothetical protein
MIAPAATLRRTAPGAEPPGACLQDFGTELVIFHGGVGPTREALSDLAVLSVDQQEFLQLEASPSAVGPAARAFHAAAVCGRHLFVFGGHVFLPEAKRLHQFNDLWALDTVRALARHCSVALLASPRH